MSADGDWGEWHGALSVPVVPPGSCSWISPPGFLSCLLVSNDEVRLGRWKEAVVAGPLRRLGSFISRVSRWESRRLFRAESEELVRATEMGEGSSNSSRACMRFAVGLMKDGGGKTTSSNGESGSGSGCAEAGGALPFMLDAVVSRAGADFLLENSRSSLSNPLAMVGGGEMGVVSGVFVRNLYCQLHSILAQLAGAVHTCRANLRGSAAHTGSEDYVAVGSVVARGLRPYKRLMISLFDRQWALSRRSDLDAPTQHPTQHPRRSRWKGETGACPRSNLSLVLVAKGKQ